MPTIAASTQADASKPLVKTKTEDVPDLSPGVRTRSGLKATTVAPSSDKPPVKLPELRDDREEEMEEEEEDLHMSSDELDETYEYLRNEADHSPPEGTSPKDGKVRLKDVLSKQFTYTDKKGNKRISSPWILFQRKRLKELIRQNPGTTCVTHTKTISHEW